MMSKNTTGFEGWRRSGWRGKGGGCAADEDVIVFPGLWDWTIKVLDAQVTVAVESRRRPMEIRNRDGRIEIVGRRVADAKVKWNVSERPWENTQAVRIEVEVGGVECEFQICIYVAFAISLGR